MYGIPSNPDRNKARNEKITAAYKAGISGIKIAKKFSLSPSQAYRIIRGRKKGRLRRKKVVKNK